ncbi:hypothetical protein FDO65_16790 [Nakamurella flava]|uniref:DUF7336 domain-containing protein n=1 Tax=Nakamurella flava TaxID=2576308 RepID=A0A4U6QCV6_9ACTN|nr:hypothetical protein [Nakamurella flava]TKV57792.1 hypothetical protein FDO65_16790 [Nakamurella flava]
MQVHLVWHVRHHATGGQVVHARDGELSWEETDGDDVKLLGVFSTRDRADERIALARTQPGFRDEPDCFLVDAYTVDLPAWDEGFGQWIPQRASQP